MCPHERRHSGPLLRELRRAKSLTMEALAEASGVSVRGIGDLERGRRAAPQRRTVAALADGLGLDDTERGALARRRPRRTHPRLQPRRRPLLPARHRRLRRPCGRAGPPGGARRAARGGRRPRRGRRRPARPPRRRRRPRPRPARARPPSCCAPPAASPTASPDGQLMVDLRGTDDSPPAPSELIVRVLKALGVPDRDLAKAGPQAHSALYRQVLADRRCLLMLDNARDEAQVRPLLPGSGGTLVLVTSRRMLTGLDDVHRLPLGRLEPAESAAFLASLVGTDRAAAEPEAVGGGPALCAPAAGPPGRGQLAGHTHRVERAPARGPAGARGTAAGRAVRRGRPGGERLLPCRTGNSHPRPPACSGGCPWSPGPDVSAAGAARLTGQGPLRHRGHPGGTGRGGAARQLRGPPTGCTTCCACTGRCRLAAEGRRGGHRAGPPVDVPLAAGDGRRGRPVVRTSHGAPPPSWRGTVDLSSADKARDWLHAEAANWLAALHRRRRGRRPRHRRRGGRVPALVLRPVDVLGALARGLPHRRPVRRGPRRPAARSDPAQLLRLGRAAVRGQTAGTACGTPPAPPRRGPPGRRLRGRQAWAHQYAAWAHHLLGEGGPAAGQSAEAVALFQAAGDLHGPLQALARPRRAAAGRRAGTRKPSRSSARC
ncbi:helix-turn-helix transcriptional regulator [Streptomyces tricolor]|nr:helix-turn-helix transcriptional regulator [Streptomyces tricolor]